MTPPVFVEAVCYAVGLPFALVDVSVHGLGGFGGVAVVLFAVAALGRAYAAIVSAHVAMRKASRPSSGRKPCSRCERLGRFSNPSKP